MLLRSHCDNPVQFFDSLTLIVGQDEHPLSLVRRADFTRAEYSPRRRVTKASQLFDDISESEGDMSFDVLKEAESGSQNANAICDVGPEVAGVIFSEPLSCAAEGLAGITSREDVHAISKAVPWEGFEIRPDRSRINLPAFHSRKKELAGEGFDLRISNCAQTFADCSSEAEVDSAIAGAKREMSDCGSIHVILKVFRG